ncbi:hypothetical protein BGY98DRAFT_1173292 [Russula aff. rugulosa BPL654]|nr:hypothetical protein BGY98DRAFT_1173292 [Russula aff. rugulosa BPL654]
MAFAGLLHPQVNVDFDAVNDKILRREYRPDANYQTQSLHTGHLHVFITLPEEDYRPTISLPWGLYRSKYDILNDLIHPQTTFATEMSDTAYYFLCLLEGDKTPFYVVASPTVFIGELKYAIKKKSVHLQGVDASDLTLCKVNVDYNAVNDKIMRREYRPDANDQPQSLHTAEAICSQIFEVWPEPPPHNYRQVFITLPDEAENGEDDNRAVKTVSFHGIDVYKIRQDHPYSNVLATDCALLGEDEGVELGEIRSCGPFIVVGCQDLG